MRKVDAMEANAAGRAGTGTQGGAGDAAPGAAGYRPGRRKAVRALVPVGVAGVTAATIGLVPALAADSTPALPHLSAQQLVAKALAADAHALSGTVSTTADLGIPAGVLGGATMGQGGPWDHARRGGRTAGPGSGGGTAAPAGPQSRLTELLSGSHTLRIAVDGPDRQRIGLVEPLAEYEVVHDGDQMWAWDSRTDQAVHSTLPRRAHPRAPRRAAGVAPFGHVPDTPQAAAAQFLRAAGPTTAVRVAGTARVAGRDAYELSLSPRQQGSTIGEVRIAVDARTGVPLGVRVLPREGGKAAFDMHFTSVSFATPAASVFHFTPPKGATVTQRPAPGTGPALRGPAQHVPGAWKHAPGAWRHDRSWHGGGMAGHHNGAAWGHGMEGHPGGTHLTGTGWTAVFGTALPKAAAGGTEARLLKSLGKPVAGGRLVTSRLLNALVTDDGRVFVGAVTPQVLEQAAGAAR